MTPVWRKSIRSGSGQGGQSDCVEVAKLVEGIGLRDSKAPDTGHLSLSAASFSRLLNRVKRDELNL